MFEKYENKIILSFLFFNLSILLGSFIFLKKVTIKNLKAKIKDL